MTENKEKINYLHQSAGLLKKAIDKFFNDLFASDRP